MNISTVKDRRQILQETSSGLWWYLGIVLMCVLSGCSYDTTTVTIENKESLLFHRNQTDRVVTLEAGESLNEVAAKYKVPVELLASINGISEPYTVSSRTIITVPVGGRYHKVESGDTMASIANRYGVTVETLLELNNIAQREAEIPLKAGTFILIPTDATDNLGGQDEVETTKIEDDYIREESSSTSDQAMKDAPAQRVKQPAKSSDEDWENSMSGLLQDSSTEVVAPSEAAASATLSPTALKLPYPLGDPKFSWPVQGDVLYHFQGSAEFNEGISIAAPANTIVRAAAKGTVIHVEASHGKYGNLLILQHDGQYLTAYAHNSKLLVTKGAEVAKGQAIAKVGSTGQASQPQLYFSIKHGKTILNPEVIP